MAGSTRSFEMARRLVEMGHQVEIITSMREYELMNSNLRTIESGIGINWINVNYSNHMGFWSRINSFVKFAVLAFFKAMKIQGDFIFASSTPLTISLPGIFAARLKGIPFYFEVRDLWPELPIAMGYLKNPFLRYFALKLEKFSYTSSKKIIALSEGMKDGIISAGYPENKITVIPNGADLDLFDFRKLSKNHFRKKFGYKSKDIIVLYPGTFGHVNNLDYLVDLASKFIHVKNIKFLLVGDGIERELIINRAKSLNLYKINMFFYDKISKLEITNFFSISDIIVSTILPLKQLEANSANKFFDALASGTCMVINHGGWQENELINYNCGFRLPRSLDEAFVKLKYYTDNPNLLKIMGQNARILAENKYSRDILAKQLATFFESENID
jgi:glycosyltransferase involved in cell wall biosynthesis